MTFTRWRDLVLLAVICGVLVNLLAHIGYGNLPPVPRLTGSSLGVLAIVEAAFTFNLRARIKHKSGTTPVPALTAARAVLVAKASSKAGAAMVGAWAGLLVYVLPDVGLVTAASDDTWTSVIGLVCALALVGAGLWLEWCLRTPGGSDESDRTNGPV